MRVVTLLICHQEKQFFSPITATPPPYFITHFKTTHVYAQDLITLPHLHEPAILHSLSERFRDGNIYTFTGPILIAVNPFKSVPLYTDRILETYFETGLLAAQGAFLVVERCGSDCELIREISCCWCGGGGGGGRYEA